jgi:nucleoside phosphorylase
MSTKQSLAIDAYHVGIICALPHEMTAAAAMLDEVHAKPQEQNAHDHNTYTLGQMSQHNTVIACLPAGVCGTNAAATVARDMLRTFTGLRVGLMVGIGGGIPSRQRNHDIRLGDVVVSQPDDALGGVVQYDMGKTLGNGTFVRKGALNRPPTLLLTALSKLRSEEELGKSRVQEFVQEAYRKHSSLQEQGYMSPGEDMDRLQCASCRPSRWWWILWLLVVWLCPLLACQDCNRGEVRRRRRDRSSLRIHYGTIASGNQVIKDSSKRDKLGREFGALCVEMEAAGLMNEYPCIVIRGICDYADSRKSDGWQKYAAMTAAACAKDLLQHVSPGQTREQRRIQDVVGMTSK